MPQTINTILDAIDSWSATHPDRVAFQFLDSNGVESDKVTFKELRNRSMSISREISLSCNPGERAVLFFQPGLEFIYAFLGCLYSKVIAVPIPPPQGKRQLGRVNAVLANATPSIFLSTKFTRTQIEKQTLNDFSLFSRSWIDVEDLTVESEYASQNVFSYSSVAFLQYTSGSTSNPKGVIISHCNLIQNEIAIAEAFNHSEKTVVVGWLPFYHDMGLIGNILQPLYLGVKSVLMAPTTFLQNPNIWLKTITKYKATTSGGPNFAYQLCVNRISEDQFESLDLSSWTVAFNGSEMIHASTLKAFQNKFNKCGFRSNAFYPCYGLAESTLFATGITFGDQPRILIHDEGQKKLPVVSCGTPRYDQNVKIVNPQTLIECSQNEIGEVWLSGKSIATGYWNLPEISEKVFQVFTEKGEGPFMRTGDLGFVDNRELFLTGRLKNLIILNGRNLYPDDIEHEVQKSHSALANALGAAFSITEGTEEKLIIIHEIERSAIKNLDSQEVIKQIRKCLTEVFFVDPSAILLVKPGSIPKTTSGKIQYYLCRKSILEGSFPSIVSWNPKQSIARLPTDNSTINSVNELEMQIIVYLSSLLRIPCNEIINTEPILQYGMDSLKAMRLISWIHETFKARLELDQFFEGISVADIVTHIKSSLPFDSSAQTTSLDHSKPHDDVLFPLAPNQEALWTLHQFSPDSVAYNIPIVLTATGKWNFAAFESAINDLVQRHTILRTSFLQQDGTPFQKIRSNHQIPLIHKDFRSFENDAIQRLCSIEIQQEAFKPFKLDSDHLLRVKTFALSEKEVQILLTFHHLICDGWSMNVFIEDLRIAYNARCKEEEPKWMSAPGQYFDFVLKHHEVQKTAQYALMKDYWTNYLKEESSILYLSPFHQHPKAPSDEGKSETLILPNDLVNKLQAFNKQNKITTAITLMAVLHSLIHLYSNQKTLFIGYPSANRSNPNLQDVIGYFVNTLVCKTTFSPDSQFIDILQQVKSGIRDGIKYEAFAFQDILKTIKPSRIDGVSPIFQAMFVMQNAPRKISDFKDIDIQINDQVKRPVIYDLVLEVAEHQNTLELKFEYKIDCLPRWIIQQFASHFVKLLDMALKQPHQSLQQFDLLNPSEMQLVTQSLNSTILPRNASSVIEMFEQQVNRTPNAIAIQSDLGTWNYAELNAKAEAIATSLKNLGVTDEEPVGFFLERSPELIATMLGIAKCGAAYVPLDSNYPESRTQYMIEDAGIRFLITQNKFKLQFSSFVGDVIDIHDLCASSASHSKVKSSYRPNLKGLSYILYTSGSTGRPKGVMVEQKSLLNFTLGAIKLFEINSKDRILQFSSISWDTSSEEIYPCLTSGACLVLRSNDPVETFDSLISRTMHAEITIWDLPTSYWQELCDYLISKKLILPPSLRLIIVGGERINRSKVQAWHAFYGDQIRLLNTYGATEATSISTAFDLIDWHKIYVDIPIGKPIENVKTYILNKSLQLLPPGVVGDLYVAGEGLARGYRNMTEATNQKFFVHSLLNERIYLTGDLGYFAPNGDLLLQGRSDHQIKRRGFRIELEEIETSLNQQDYISRSLVVQKDGMQLIAYIVLKENASPERVIDSAFTNKIRTDLQGVLPEYMLPDQYKFIADFPRLPNGKIDYIAVEALSLSVQVDFTPGNEVLSDREKKISEIWKILLDIKHIGKQVSFFDAGGNSLLIIKLHHQITEVFSIQFAIAELFTHKTIESQARMVDESIKVPSSDLLKQLEEGEIDFETAKQLLIRK